METHENSSLLQGLKHRIRAVPPPDGSALQLENQVMEYLQSHPSSMQTQGVAGLSIAITWMIAASIAFFMVFFYAAPDKIDSHSSEFTLLEEELFEVSNDEIQSWIMESRPELSQDALLTELTEYELSPE